MPAGSSPNKTIFPRAWLTPLVLIGVAVGAILLNGTANTSFALTGPDCIVCHTGNAPTGAPYPSFDYYNPDQEPDGTMVNEHHYYVTVRPRHSCFDCHPTNVYKTIGVCVNCHYENSTFGDPRFPALGINTAHKPLHDMTDVPDPLCLDCHSPSVYDEHLGRVQFVDAQGDFSCFTCHNDTYSAAFDIAAAGGIVTCTDCHTDIGVTGHAADHDNVLPNAGCDTAGCHQSNVMIEHTNRPSLSCDTCHGNNTVIAGSGAVLSPQQVIDAAAGPFDPATTAYCRDCHGPNAGMHAAAHDQGFFLASPDGQDCSRCHASMDILIDPNQADLVTEHVSNQGFGCQVCHNQEVIDLNAADVASAIDKGRNQNLPVYCVDCHAPTGQGEGHKPITVEPWSQCKNCHTIEIPGWPEHNMHVDAIQAALAYGSPQLNLLANTECSACHVPETGSPNCTACHSLTNPTPPFTLEVYLTSPNTSLNIIGPGTEDHDRHTNALTSCNYCHVSGAPGADPIVPPYNECSNCHNGTASPETFNMTLTDIRFGAPGHNAHMAAANNNCSVCHTAQPDCSSCHSPGHPAIPAPYNQCDQCHSGLLPGQVVHEQNHIPAATLPSGYVDCTVCHNPQPDCTQCHIADDGSGHAGVHDNVGVPSPGCTKCHDANVVVEHVDNRGLTCGTCHDNPAYTAIIDRGKTDDPANFVECYDCHDQNNHHATTESQAGNCTYCHADPRPVVYPEATVIPSGQLACRECHGTNQHDNGGPIQDYSACFACHLGIQQYHAKPTSWPGWYEENQPAPGRGSFNIFSSEFRPRCAGNCEGTSYERLSGYGEGRSPERDAGRNWVNPNISFNWITFFDFATTNQEWTVPTFESGSGSGGGTTPPSSDTVNITYADYNSSRNRLTVYAENTLGDSNNTRLTVNYNNNEYPMSWSSYRNRWEVQINSYRCYDSTIEVVSSAGGSDSTSVGNCSSYSSWGR